VAASWIGSPKVSRSIQNRAPRPKKKTLLDTVSASWRSTVPLRWLPEL
jgi:hypothetical protein